jgi:hypothetical protein
MRVEFSYAGYPMAAEYELDLDTFNIEEVYFEGEDDDISTILSKECMAAAHAAVELDIAERDEEASEEASVSRYEAKMYERDNPL